MKKIFTLLLLSTAFAALSQDGSQKDLLPQAKSSNRSARTLVQKPATVTPCAGGNAVIPAGLNGSIYQWQVNTGGGFNNVSNGGVYSGATTNTLQINGAPTSLYGYQYRCVVDGNFGAVYTLTFTTTWTGAIDNNWENSTNWNCGSVPDANTDVIINSGTPVLNSNRSVRTLTAGGGNTVTVRSGFVLTITR